MPRQNKPWFSASRQAWCAKIGGKQYTLSRGRASKGQALRAFEELKRSLGRVEARRDDMGLAAMLDYYLLKVKETVESVTWDGYRRHCRNFIRYIGTERLAGSITKDDVRAWLDRGWVKRLPKGEDGQPRSERRPYLPSTRHGAIMAIKIAYEWAKREKLVKENPLADMGGPGIGRSKGVLDGPSVRRIIEATGGPFGDLVEFLWETGCRPSEATRLSAAHFNREAGVVVMPGKTTRKTGKDRVIYLTGRAAEILRENAARNPEGAVFRNTQGRPWTRHAMAQQFARLRGKLDLGKDATSEAIRHGFGTDGALKLKPMVLAHAMGHTGTSMINRYYVHLDRRPEEMKAAVESVRGARSDDELKGLAVRPTDDPRAAGGGIGPGGGAD